MRRLHDSGMGVKRIAAALSRSTDTVSKHLFKKNTTKKSKGRPKHSIRTPKGFLAAQRAYKKLLKSSGGTKEVTAAMLKSEMKLKCDIKTVRRAFAENGYQFRPLYEKPDLSDGDKKERLQWAREHKHRSPSQWSQYVHACMDNKVFQVLPNAKYRKVAAKRNVRGVCRKRKRDFSVGHVKPSNPKVLKQSSGKGSVTIACAIGAGKVLMWHQVVGRWNAAAAGRMYSGALQPALKRAYPSVRGKFRVMEDNDPTGYKSRSGMAAKKSAGIQTLDLPKRSPDLMPLDFAFWANLNKRMRGQEKDWPASKTETRAQYLARLRRTALATPSEYIHSIMGSLHKRCGLLVEAKGGHFAEGGGPEKRRRLVGKQSQQTALLEHVVGEENRNASREVYLVTLPHTDKEGLRAPAAFSREEVRDAFLDCCGAPDADPAWLASHRGQGAAPVGVKKLVVFKEYHAPVAGVRRAHYHVALHLGKKSKFLTVKRALLNRYQLASHWSCSHDGHWSAVGYCANATPKKPRTAREQVEGEKGKPEPRVEEVDLWPIVVRSGIRNTPDDPHAVRKLMAYAKTSCSHKVVAWMFKNEHVLEKIIDKAWAWENVDSFLEDATKPVMQQFKEALRTPCVCGGRWLHHVRESLSMNRIDVPDLCSSILMSLKHGRSEAAPVVTLAGRFGGEGKSLLFSAVRPLFGGEHVQERPGGGQFCLHGLDKAKAAVLDEWMFIDEDLPLSIQLLWLEGKPVPITMPQNQHVGHKVYMGSAPIFVTCPETALAGLSSESSQRPQGQAGMLLRRLKLYLFTVPIPKPPAPKLVPCPRCFSTLVTSEAANKAANEAAYEAPSEAANEASYEAARGAAKKTAVEATGEAASEAANEHAYKKLLKSSGGTKEVTAAMLKSEMKLKCDIKTVRRAFAENGYQFRPLYEKPDLSDGDKKERLQWAREHKHWSPSQWSQYVHACMDNRVSQVLPNAKYRKVPKQSSGKGSVTIACAIGAGKVLMWHQVVGRWNAAAAGRMYSGALQPALKRAYPSVRGKFRVMEDNDPTGYKSRSGMVAKTSAGIQTLDLPKRSPDLMPLDFAFWANLNKRMRGQETDWPASKTETRAQYLARLRRTALATPSEYIHSIMGSLHKRCGLLVGGSQSRSTIKSNPCVHRPCGYRWRARRAKCAALRQVRRTADKVGHARPIDGARPKCDRLRRTTPGCNELPTEQQVSWWTLPHTDKEGLRAPAAFSREEVRDAFLDCCGAPYADPAWLASHRGQGAAPVGVKKLVVFKEYHAPVAGVRRAHYHVALHLGKKSKFLTVKRALLNRYQLASHWSCSHDGHWSAVGYCANATPNKPRSALDVDYLAWPADHPPLSAAKREPTTARALEKRRTAREQVEGEKGKPEPRVEEVDLWPIVVRSGIRNTPDDPHAVRKLMAYAKTSCSHKVVAWMFKNEHVLEKIIDKAWAWENVDSFLEDATKPVMQQFKEALRTPCVGGGRWLHHVRESLSMNRIDVPDLCSSILMSLKHGRSEAAPVVTLAGRFGGEGKSLLFSAFRPLFGGEHVQERPGGGQFCLHGLDKAKAAVLDEWLFIDEDLPLSIQLLWLEGKPVPITMPQNQHVGHKVYMGSAPNFVTCPETALAGLSSESSQRPQGQACMLLRRLILYLFTVPIPKPPAPKLVPCPRCFSTLDTSEALKFKPK
ncbi:unnamed protein product [Prorocentrum cordatum]|uniref:Uncharacterized protein n=1 Tax=Prorocentrum cordatum TaxID=2364126 RepID=A0ABN9QUN3_9DINO|nr:unnamed protein product [Polarella glacialis]